MSKVMKLIDYNNLDELRTGFINYLKTHHPDKARPDVRAGNASVYAHDLRLLKEYIYS